MRLLVGCLAAFVAIAPITAAADGANPACIPARSCVDESLDEIQRLAPQIHSTIDRNWIFSQGAELVKKFEPACDRHRRCVAVLGNSQEFCRGILWREAQLECDQLTNPSDRSQCYTFVFVWAIGQGRPGTKIWQDAQRCASEHAADGKVVTPPSLELVPGDPKPNEPINLVVRATDPSTGDPVEGIVWIDGVRTGMTFEPIRKWRLSWVRETAADGEVSFRSPVVTVAAATSQARGFPGYGELSATFSTPVPHLRLTIEPAAASWIAGVNKAKVTANDPATGEQVDGVVFSAGNKVVGNSGASFTFKLQQDAAGLCGTPLWFRPSSGHLPDEDLGVRRCN